MNKKLHKSLEKYNKSKEDAVVPISGTLGIPLGGQKLVEVPNRQGFVYVKLKDNTSEVIQAYNSSVSNTYDLPVLVIRSNNIYRVLGRNLDLYRDWGNIPYLPKHGGQHSFNPMLSMGADITWIYSQQIMPLLGYPSGTEGSPRITVAPYLVQDLSGNWKYVGNTGTQSTTPYNPTTGSRAVMALVYLDTVSGNPYLLVNSGTYISESLTGTNQVAPYIPQVTNPNHIPITAIRLLSGTSTLTWNNLYDARPFLRVVPTGTSGGSVNPPVTGSVVMFDDWNAKGSVLGHNFGLGLLAGASGSYGNVDVDFGTGTFQAARGNHNHTGGYSGLQVPYTSLINKPSSVIPTSLLYDAASVSTSGWSGTIATLPGGATLTYTDVSGNENTIGPSATTYWAKQRLYNTTRGDYALIDANNTGTNTITLNAAVPAGWTVGDTITTLSQTVSGGGFNWVDLEIISGAYLEKSLVGLLHAITDTGGAGGIIRFHPFETYAGAKVVAQRTQSAQRLDTTMWYTIISNVITVSWVSTGAGTLVVQIKTQMYME